MDEKITDTLENNDAVSEEMRAKLSNVIEMYKKMSDEEKEEFHKGAFSVLNKYMNKLPGNTFLPAWLAPYQSHILFIFAVSVVILLFVIFTLNLHWRTKEREYRREMKKKVKEQRAGKKKK